MHGGTHFLTYKHNKQEFNKYNFFRLLFGSNGPAQWRLNGIDAMENAAEIVKSVPVTSSAKFVPILLLILLLLVIMFFIYNPVLIPLMALPYVIYSQRSKLFK